MSYDGNELGYDTGYDTESTISPKSRSIKNASSHFQEITYLMAGGATGATAAKPTPTFIPFEGKDPDKKDGVLGLRNGKVEWFPKDKIPKDAQGIQVEVVGFNNQAGKKNDTYLVRYRDDKGNEILDDKGRTLYDEVDRDTATKKLNISPAVLDDPKLTKPIEKGTFFAGQLGQVEKSNKQIDLTDKDAPSVSVNDITSKNKTQIWEPGGYMYRRLQEYGYSHDDIQLFKAEYGGLDPTKADEKKTLDEAIPPLDDKERNTKAGEAKKKEKIESAMVDKMVVKQGKALADKVNGDKKEGDPGYITPEEGQALVVQKYKDEHVDIYGKPVDLKRVSGSSGEVDTWIKGLPDQKKIKEDIGDKHPSEHPALAQTWNQAIKNEKEGMVNLLAPQMPGPKAADKRTQARLYLANMEIQSGDKLDSPGEYRMKRNEMTQEMSTDAGKKMWKERGISFWEGVKKDPQLHSTLAVKTGDQDLLNKETQKEFDQILNQVPAKERAQAKLALAQKRIEQKFEDEKRVKDLAMWNTQQDRMKADKIEEEKRQEEMTKRKEARDEAKEIRADSRRLGHQMVQNKTNLYDQQTSQITMEAVRGAGELLKAQMAQSGGLLKAFMDGIAAMLTAPSRGPR